jgi:predicted deacetylase
MARFQKLIKNLFLTLHGYSTHRQQRELPKFLMRYQQFACHAYCGAAGPVSKMAWQQEKAFCVPRFVVSRSVITKLRECRARFKKLILYGAVNRN